MRFSLDPFLGHQLVTNGTQDFSQFNVTDETKRDYALGSVLLVSGFVWWLFAAAFFTCHASRRVRPVMP